MIKVQRGTFKGGHHCPALTGPSVLLKGPTIDKGSDKYSTSTTWELIWKSPILPEEYIDGSVDNSHPHNARSFILGHELKSTLVISGCHTLVSSRFIWTTSAGRWVQATYRLLLERMNEIITVGSDAYWIQRSQNTTKKLSIVFFNVINDV